MKIPVKHRQHQRRHINLTAYYNGKMLVNAGSEVGPEQPKTQSPSPAALRDNEQTVRNIRDHLDSRLPIPAVDLQYTL